MVFGHRTRPFGRNERKAPPGTGVSSGSRMMAIALSSLRFQAPAAAASLRWVDACAAVLSGLCAVHCAITPLLVGVLPAFASDDTEMGLRRALLAMGLFGVGMGTLLHRDRRALVPLGGALLLALLLEVGAVLPAWEVFLSLAISAFLVTAHALNTQACNARCTGCAPARFWAARAQSLGRGEVGPGMLAVAAAILVHATVLAVAVRVGSASAAQLTSPPAADPIQTVEVELTTDASLAPVTEAPAMHVPARLIPSPSTPVEPPSTSSAKSAASADSTGDVQPVSFDDVLAVHAPVRFQQVIGRESGAGQVAGRSAPVARRDAVVAGGAAPNARDPVPAEVGSSSRRPRQPAHLGALIEAHYPASARAQGVNGVGRTRLLVSPEGVVVQAVVVSEDPPGHGFARACASALQGSKGWGEPLDASGRPVSTWIRFSCEFAIRH